MYVTNINFPEFTGKRCLMMPYVQGDPESVPKHLRDGYEEIIESLVKTAGEVGYLTIDESLALAGKPHRGARSKFGRALHTEAGRHPDKLYAWGGGGWGRSHRVTLERDVSVFLANSVDLSCAIWDTVYEDTSLDGDIGFASHMFPYSDAEILRAGEVYEIGILTPHESLPVAEDIERQFIRIVTGKVNGREPYFTENPLLKH